MSPTVDQKLARLSELALWMEDIACDLRANHSDELQDFDDIDVDIQSIVSDIQDMIDKRGKV